MKIKNVYKGESKETVIRLMNDFIRETNYVEYHDCSNKRQKTLKELRDLFKEYIDTYNEEDT